MTNTTETTTATTESVFQSRLRAAEASKQAGNAALTTAGGGSNAKLACFHYKKVCLFLTEYIPADVAASALNPLASSSSSGGGSADGLVGLLQQQRRRKGGDTNGNSNSNHTVNNSSSDVPSPSEEAAMYAVLGATLNNLAFAHFKLGRFREGAAATTCLVSRVPGYQGNAKALLRRGHCRLGLGDTAAAGEDAAALIRAVALAVKAGEVEANSAEFGGMSAAAVAAMAPDAAALGEAVDSAKRAGHEKEKKMYQRMFAAEQ